jgi:hypothetical protein
MRGTSAVKLAVAVIMTAMVAGRASGAVAEASVIAATKTTMLAAEVADTGWELLEQPWLSW